MQAVRALRAEMAAWLTRERCYRGGLSASIPSAAHAARLQKTEVGRGVRHGERVW